MLLRHVRGLTVRKVTSSSANWRWVSRGDTRFFAKTNRKRQAEMFGEMFSGMEASLSCLSLFSPYKHIYICISFNIKQYKKSTSVPLPLAVLGRGRTTSIPGGMSYQTQGTSGPPRFMTNMLSRVRMGGWSVDRVVADTLPRSKKVSGTRDHGLFCSTSPLPNAGRKSPPPHWRKKREGQIVCCTCFTYGNDFFPVIEK